MLSVLALLPSWLSGDGLIKAFGDYALYGVVAVIFAECGILLGFVLPGDSLIFALGMLTATGVISQPIAVSLTLIAVAAIAGNMTGYWLGASIGPRIFKTDSRFFKPQYVDRTSVFFERYGNRAIIFARFVPIVRTVITALAGVGHMDRGRFFKFTAIGGIIWVVGNGLLGYWLGNVDFIRNNLQVSLILIVIISFIPIITEGIRMRREQRNG